MDRIYVFDTTLRDGEQAPGASMEEHQKIEIAERLAKMGVDVIEAGFPISSPKQFNTTKKISKQIKDSTITALARALPKDIDAAADAIVDAAHGRIHTFLATSPIHREFKLRKNKEEVLEMIEQSVRYACNKVAEVEFSPEDATRTEIDFLCQAVEIAINAGASIINIPDTVGYTTPWEMYEIISSLRNNVPNIDKAVLSVHCHDDLGLAVANTLSAVKAGARQVEVTLNGIGERAGNAALEECIMGLVVRKDFWHLETNIQTEHIYPLARLLSTTIGYPIPRNKAIIGNNAFAHEAGIHQDGVLKNRKTYEILTPAMVGRNNNKIILGRHSGIRGLRARLEELSIKVADEDFEEYYNEFIKTADKKKEVFDEDLYVIHAKNMKVTLPYFAIKSIDVSTHTEEAPIATVSLSTVQGEKTAEGTGDGPIDAVFSAIGSIMQVEGVVLEEFHIDAITPGKDAIGSAHVIISINNHKYSGYASSTDILAASSEAYIMAINNYFLLSRAKAHINEL